MDKERKEEEPIVSRLFRIRLWRFRCLVQEQDIFLSLDFKRPQLSNAVQDKFFF